MRAHRRREAPFAAIARGAVVVGVVAVLVPLARPVFFAFLDDPAATGEGTEAAVQRAGLLIIGLLAVDMYAALVRGPERLVLETLPVDGARVAMTELARVGSERAPLVLAMAAVFAPVALERSALAWAASLVALAGVYALAIPGAAVVHLSSIDAATSPRWAPLLDALRGANPREQAAFIYAPGVVLAFVGAVALAAAAGVRAVTDGDPRGWAAIAAPWLLAPIAAALVPGLARRTWFAGSAVLADIDARYASLERPEEARAAYLDWTVRWLPAGVARYALRDLRHAWRARRGFISGAWVGGVLAAFAGWSADPSAPARAAAAVVIAVFGFGAIGAVLETDEPGFLRAWLPKGGADAALGRAWAEVLWLQGCLWPAIAASLVRHGPAGGGLVLGSGVAAIALATLLALLARRAGPRATAVYAPVATVCAAVLAALVSS